MEKYRHAVRAYIEKHLLADVDGFSDDENFFEKRFVNSLFAMQLVSFIEKQVGTEIDGEDLSLENFSSVSRIVKLMAKMMKEEVA
jgi:methoxymalonate biosynthesis acyl carrier protein